MNIVKLNLIKTLGPLLLCAGYAANAQQVPYSQTWSCFARCDIGFMDYSANMFGYGRTIQEAWETLSSHCQSYQAEHKGPMNALHIWGRSDSEAATPKNSCVNNLTGNHS